MTDETSKELRLKLLFLAGELISKQVKKFFLADQDPYDRCIVVADVDDDVGRDIADATMPGYDWDTIRAQGKQPLAIGSMSIAALRAFSKANLSAQDLAVHDPGNVMVVVIAHSGAMIAEIAQRVTAPSVPMN